MDALNALALKPICLLSEKSSKKPRKVFSIPNLKLPTPSSPETLSSLLLSSFLAPKPGLALTYEEALQQSINSSSGLESDTGFTDFFDGILSFASDNPLVIGGGLVILAVPLIVSQLLGKPKKSFGVEPASKAYAKLGDEPSAELLDIRSPKDVRKMGSPDIRGLRKKPVPVAYNSEDKSGFLLKLALKFKDPENTTLFILDKYDGNSELVAELAATNGFKAAYAIKDGAEGTRGWMNSGLPWMLPKKTLSFDLSSLIESLTGSLPEGSEALLVTLGLVAVTGAGSLAFVEMETILQVLGLLAFIQLTATKLLTTKDRERTLQQVDEFLSTKVVLKEFVSDLKQIGAAFLPTTAKTIPAPVEANSAPETPVKEVESITEIQTTELKVEEAPETNSAPQTKQLGVQRPLSPFPLYPDLKPPSSPSPSAPSSRPTIPESPVKEVESVTVFTEMQLKELNVEEASEAAPETNSVPQTEAKEESNNGFIRPLSPFPLYPDLKPPSSPSPSAPSSRPTIPETPVIKEVESTTVFTEMQLKELNVEEASEAAPETNSVPQTEAKEESNNGVIRPLSPFPLYPDLKPPSSPCPSQP